MNDTTSVAFVESPIRMAYVADLTASGAMADFVASSYRYFQSKSNASLFTKSASANQLRTSRSTLRDHTVRGLASTPLMAVRTTRTRLMPSPSTEKRMPAASSVSRMDTSGTASQPTSTSRMKP